jgi:hypothetical protein
MKKLNPFLNDGAYVFIKIADAEQIPQEFVAVFKEAEGYTVILKENDLSKEKYKSVFRAAWITFAANTDLNDLGITAAFSKVLSENGISCNVFAPIHHDHIFVPFEQGQKALNLLKNIDI